MADETRRVEHYSATIPDKAGEGARVLGALRDAAACEDLMMLESDNATRRTPPCP